ncbi:hypothetical protein HOC11_09000 [archaeon]|jgi:hypothetical protein|nr:hypothetical protein [archaeon]
MSNKVKIQYGSNRFHVTIPMSLVHAKGWKKGTELEWKLDSRGKLVLIE